MGRPRTTSDEAILGAARALFREGGHAVPTREIARAAGVSQAVLFQRFPSKSELFFAAMAPDAPDVAAILGNPTDAVESYLRGVANRLLAFFEVALPTVVQLMAHPEFDARAMGSLHERILAGKLVDALAERLAGFRERGLVGDIDTHAAAATLVAALHSIVVFHMASGGTLQAHAKRMTPRIISVLWGGLKP